MQSEPAVRRGVLVVVFLLIAAAPAAAQAPAKTFAEFASIAKTGERVTVTGGRGDVSNSKIASATASQLVFIALSPGATPAFAQDSSGSLASILTAGTRVRVKTTELAIPTSGTVMKHPSGMRQVGAVESATATQLILRGEKDLRFRIPLAAISEVDVSVGRHRNFRTLLAVGAGIGLLSGMTAGVNS